MGGAGLRWVVVVVVVGCCWVSGWSSSSSSSSYSSSIKIYECWEEEREFDKSCGKREKEKRIN